MIFLSFKKLKFTSWKYISLRKLQFPSVINTRLTVLNKTLINLHTQISLPQPFIKWSLQNEKQFWCHTWLMHIIGVLNLMLKLWSCAPNVCKYRAFVTESEAPNSQRNKAAMESTTTKRTMPLASSREIRLVMQLWKVSYHKIKANSFICQIKILIAALIAETQVDGISNHKASLWIFKSHQ